MSEYRARLFIGSSSESLEWAQAVQRQLGSRVATRLWTDSVFAAGQHTLGSLVEASKEFDFAVFFLSDDDKLESRGASYSCPRDNVVFEYGLFAGAIGPERVYGMTPREPADTDTTVRIPSDLAGVTMLKYDTTGSAQDAVASAGASLLERIETLGPRHEKELQPAMLAGRWIHETTTSEHEKRTGVTQIEVSGDGSLRVTGRNTEQDEDESVSHWVSEGCWISGLRLSFLYRISPVMGGFKRGLVEVQQTRPGVLRGTYHDLAPSTASGMISLRRESERDPQ